MPLFDRLSGAPRDPGEEPPETGARPGGISPIVPGRAGRPSFSLEALRERVEREFLAATTDRADILLELTARDAQRESVREVLDYVLAVEAIALSGRDRATLLDKACGNLFGFGPLEPLLADAAVTDIAVRGPRDVHVRRLMGAPERAPAVFDDAAHLQGVLGRMLATAGLALPKDDPFLETGLTLAGRRARLSLVGPPISPDYTLDIRLHPAQPLTWEGLVASGMVADRVADLLRAVIDAGHGLLIVGEAGTGKTTVAGAVGLSLAGAASVVTVERAAELSLAADAVRRVPVLAGSGSPPTTFEDELRAGMDARTDWLVADEIRGDESAAVWEALTRPDPPRYVWIFRGSGQPHRLRSALSMVIRKSHPALDQAAIDRALAGRLPFVAVFRMDEGRPRFHWLGEHVLGGPDESPELEMRAIWQEEGGVRVASNPPQRPLALPADFFA